MKWKWKWNEKKKRINKIKNKENENKEIENNLWSKISGAFPFLVIGKHSFGLAYTSLWLTLGRQTIGLKLKITNIDYFKLKFFRDVKDPQFYWY